jgi:hypothetical protein
VNIVGDDGGRSQAMIGMVEGTTGFRMIATVPESMIASWPPPPVPRRAVALAAVVIAVTVAIARWRAR